MAELKSIYATLDIGSNYVKGVVAEIYNNKFIVLASSIVKSDGIVDCMIENNDLVVSKINEVMNELRSKVGIEINRVVLGIPASSVSIAKLYGETYIVNENRIIRSEDMQRAIVEATSRYKSESDEIVNVIPLRYNIDGYQSSIAIGSEADKLGVELLGLTAPCASVYPYLTVAEQAGLEIIDICLCPLAEMHEVLRNCKEEESTIVLNIGFSRSTMSISYKGQLKGIGTFAIGLKKIVLSLVEHYNLNPLEALRVVNKYGFNFREGSNEVVELKTLSGEMLELPLSELSSYLNHLMLSLIITFKKEIEKYNIDLFEKVFISGGCCEIDGFDQICRKVFENKCVIYKSKVIGARNAAFSTSFGLARYIVDKMEIRGRKDSSINYDLQETLVTPKKKGDSVIGKLYEYFFE